MVRDKNRKAFTLTELAIVLGAMGLLMATMWTVVGVVWDNYHLYKTKEQVFTIAQNVQNYYAPAGRVRDPSTGAGYSTGADITAELDDDARRLIPIDMREDKSTHRGDINHSLNVAPGGSLRLYSQDDGLRFRIELRNLGKDVCQRLLMEFPILMPELGVVRMAGTGGFADINTANPADPGGGVTLPLGAATASTWCPNFSTETNVVSYDFKIRF